MQVNKTSNIYGYSEIRTPIIETASLFNRGVGEETDIVSKEMYSWKDKDYYLNVIIHDILRALLRSSKSERRSTCAHT